MEIPLTYFCDGSIKNGLESSAYNSGRLQQYVKSSSELSVQCSYPSHK